MNAGPKSGVRTLPLYYLLEWRNADGFDKGLAVFKSDAFDFTHQVTHERIRRRAVCITSPTIHRGSQAAMTSQVNHWCSGTMTAKRRCVSVCRSITTRPNRW